MITTVIIAVIGSGAVFTFVQFLINRHDAKSGEMKKLNDRLDSIDHKLEKSERDSCRTQMLVLMSDYPQDRQELMRLAEHYFKDLNGDWYMTDIFCKYLQENSIEKPGWFSGGKE